MLIRTNIANNLLPTPGKNSVCNSLGKAARADTAHLELEAVGAGQQVGEEKTRFGRVADDVGSRQAVRLPAPLPPGDVTDSVGDYAATTPL